MGEEKNIIREGIISEVYPARHSARVTFEDKSDVVSAELPILSPVAFKNKCSCLPDIGEDVICIFMQNDEESGAGFIIGSRFNDVVTPPANSQEITRLDFSDGTFIQYDREKSELRIECKGNVIINGKNIYLN